MKKFVALLALSGAFFSSFADVTVQVPQQVIPGQSITIPADPGLSKRIDDLEAAVSALQGAPAPTPPASTPAPPVVPVSKIAAADIFAEINASVPFAQEVGGAGLECDGDKRGPIKGINDANGFASTTPLGMRFGKAADPADPSKKVLLFAPNKFDGLVSGAPRCEVSWWHSQPGKLKTGTDIWYAFGLYLPNWTVVPREIVISQWHQECCVNPWAVFALQGDDINLHLRWNTSTGPTQAGNSTRSWKSPGAPINKWTVFVVKAKITPKPGDGGYYKVWRDGAVVADYTGPISYNTGDARVPWAKFGAYPWGYDRTDSQGWKTPETTTLLFKNPVFVHDPSGKYSEADLRSYVLAR